MELWAPTYNSFWDHLVAGANGRERFHGAIEYLKNPEPYWGAMNRAIPPGFDQCILDKGKA